MSRRISRIPIMDDKALQIFRELVSDRANRLNGSHYPADVNSRITAALSSDTTDSSDVAVLRRDGIGFHLVDWQYEAAFLVALVLFPERFTDEEIRDGVESVLLHAPAHILEAARLGGYQTTNIFDTNSNDDQCA